MKTITVFIFIFMYMGCSAQSYKDIRQGVEKWDQQMKESMGNPYESNVKDVYRGQKETYTGYNVEIGELVTEYVTPNIKIEGVDITRQQFDSIQMANRLREIVVVEYHYWTDLNFYVPRGGIRW